MFTIVESGVFGWRLIESRPRNLGLCSRSAGDAEREDLHVEVKAADRAANEQFDLLCMAVHKRSNWLFAGSLRAGQRAAAVMRLIQSAKLNGHDPHQYLKGILERLSTQATSRLDELMPHRWEPLK